MTAPATNHQLTFAEAAARAGCTRQNIDQAVKNGKLRATPPIPRLISENDLAEWLAARKPRNSRPFGLSARQTDVLLRLHRHERPWLRRDPHYILTAKSLHRRGLTEQVHGTPQLSEAGRQIAAELLGTLTRQETP
jgi:hypothetical protein